MPYNTNSDSDPTTTNLVLASSAASIVLSIYLYAKGDKQSGIFVGLWAPTILALAAFLNTERPRSARASRNSVTQAE